MYFLWIYLFSFGTLKAFNWLAPTFSDKKSRVIEIVVLYHFCLTAYLKKCGKMYITKFVILIIFKFTVKYIHIVA